ncbi:MAG TPA: hypothetical protein VFH83_01345, partial [Spirochaetia bacterium]|nr:hypothetical protein [Spirochaetia bacterium]
MRPFVTLKHAALLLLATVIPAGCFLLPKEEQKLAPPLMEPPQITYETITARRGTILDDFRVSGMLAYANQENLSFRSRTGRLLKRYVATGDRVKSGQLLAELDTDTLTYDISIQEIEVQKARLVAQRATLLNQDKIQQQLDALDVRKAEIELESLKGEL